MGAVLEGHKEHRASGRLAYLDDLRVLAVIFVIGGHSVSLAASLVEPGSLSCRVLTFFYFIFASCNLLFVMISGALLLPVRGEGIGTFYRKRFSRVAVPLAVYYILYVCAKEGFVWLAPNHWFAMLKRIVSGEPPEAPHFWLVYVMLGLYLLTPFFRWIVQNIPEAVLSGVILAALLVNAVYTYFPSLRLHAYLAPVVDSYAGVFLLGYYLAGRGHPVQNQRDPGRVDSVQKSSRGCLFPGRRQLPLHLSICTPVNKPSQGSTRCGKRIDFPDCVENTVLVLGIASFFATGLLIFGTESYESYIYGNAPTMVLFASMFFLCVKRAARGGRGRMVRIVSKYSYSILLIHWGVMHYVVKQMLRVDVLGGGIVGGCVLMAVLTFLISLAGAVLLDNTLFRLIYGIPRWLCSRAEDNA